MTWINLSEQLPPPHTKVLVALNGSFYIGMISDIGNVLQVTGYTPTGIETNPVMWMIIPPLK